MCSNICIANASTSSGKNREEKGGQCPSSHRQIHEQRIPITRHLRKVTALHIGVAKGEDQEQHQRHESVDQVHKTEPKSLQLLFLVPVTVTLIEVEDVESSERGDPIM